MKTLKSIFYIVAAALAFASCSEDVDYTPTPKDNGEGVYFDIDHPSYSVNLKEGQTSVKVPVYRNKGGMMFSTTIANNYKGNVLTIPTIVTFAEGETKTSVDIAVDFSKVEANKVYSFVLTISDEANLSAYGGSKCSMAIAYEPVVERDWEKVGKAIVEQDVLTFNPGEVDIERERGTMNFRVAKIMQQIAPLEFRGELEGADDLVFTLDENYEPVSVECGFISTGFVDSEFGELSLYFQNTPEEWPANADIIDMCSFKRSEYTYSVSGPLVSEEGQILAIATYKINWFENSEDPDWVSRFIVDFNNDFQYLPLYGKGLFTTQTDPENPTSEQSMQLSYDGSVYYLPDLYAEGFGLAMYLTITEDSATIDIPASQALGFKSFGRDVYASMSDEIGSSYEKDEDGTITMKLGLRLHDETGAFTFGNFEETFVFTPDSADPATFYGEWTFSGLSIDNADYSDPRNPVDVPDFEVSWSGVKFEPYESEEGYNMKISGLLPPADIWNQSLAYVGATGANTSCTDDSVPAYYDGMTNTVLLGQPYMGDARLTVGTETFKLMFGAINSKTSYFTDQFRLMFDETTGALSMIKSYTSRLGDIEPDCVGIFGVSDAGAVGLLMCKEISFTRDNGGIMPLSSKKPAAKARAERKFSNLRNPMNSVNASLERVSSVGGRELGRVERF